MDRLKGVYMVFIRNPFHNFLYRIIGIKNYPIEWEVWYFKRKWNLILPFFSYRGKKWEMCVCQGREYLGL